MQLRMLEGKDPRALLAELREIQRKQVHPREADTILSTVHKAKVCRRLMFLFGDSFFFFGRSRVWSTFVYVGRWATTIIYEHFYKA